jgi:hypothetical protein
MKTMLSDPDLDLRIRQTLAAVAATVEQAPRRVARRTHVRRRIGVVVAVMLVAGAATAAVRFAVGDEYVDRIPPAHAIVSGEVDGDRYWLVESFHEGCRGHDMPGVELVVESRNKPGQEWDTTATGYGDLLDDGCTVDTSAWLPHPDRWAAGGQLVAGTMVVTVSAHPDVTGVRLVLDGETHDYRTHLVDGARYAVFELPPGAASYTVSMLEGDRVVPCSTRSEGFPRS